MTKYIAGAPIRKYRCVTRGQSANHVIAIETVKGPQGKLFTAGKPVERYDDGWRLLAPAGLAIGIATRGTGRPGDRVDVADREGDKTLAEAGERFAPESYLIADSEGRVVEARVGVRASEPILAKALEGADEVGQLVAVKIMPRGLMT